MGCLGLWILVFVLNVAHCLETPGTEERDVEISTNVIGVLGEDVYLRCQYLGQSDIINAQWKRPGNSKVKTKRLTGYHNNMAFTKDPDFSVPASATNLTVRMTVSTLEAEGEYTCVFVSEEEEITDSMVLTVIARPDIQTSVTAETDNGTHYQSVTCSAVNGKPTPQVSWSISGSPPGRSCSVEVTNIHHPNGTSTVTSVLRLPTHLQDQDSVTCVVQHSTLPYPALVSVNVETFVAPNVTIEAELVEEEEGEFWMISCRVSGGRPEAGISLVLPTPREEGHRLQREGGMGSGTQVHLYHLPAELYEGQNVSCMFDHPRFTHRELRTVTLPEFYLSSMQLLSSECVEGSNESASMEAVVLEEGQKNKTINLHVIGDVPRYTVVCTKEGGPLPESVEVVDSALRIPGPVELHHAGLYECEASYHRHKASLKLNLTVHPHEELPALVIPRIRIDVQEGVEDRLIECLADMAYPAANLSWLLPEGVSGLRWSNFTSHNGTHSVRGVLVLPACLRQKISVECVIYHPAFEQPESRRLTLPLCAPPNITVRSSAEWEGDTAYTVVQCRVDSGQPAASIVWSVGEGDGGTRLVGVQSPLEQHVSGSVSVQGTVRFPTANFSGRNVTCEVQHISLETPERRQILVPELEGPVISVFMVSQMDSPLWLAECVYRGEGAGVTLLWVTPLNTTGQAYTSLHSHSEGLKIHTRLTYQFPLALYEGQDLSCLIQNEKGLRVKRTINVPGYYISSLRVLNQTTPLSRPHGKDPIIQRLALKKNVQHQKILLKVTGSAPAFNLTCLRSDGSMAPMEGTALVFPSVVTEWETGLYVCQVSFFHHKATVLIQVELTSEDLELMVLIIICISSAAAVTLFAMATLCVFCKKHEKRHSSPKKRESLAPLTMLMQGPCSPELRKAPLPENGGQEYAQLVTYDIVIDVKSTV